MINYNMIVGLTNKINYFSNLRFYFHRYIDYRGLFCFLYKLCCQPKGKCIQPQYACSI